MTAAYRPSTKLDHSPENRQAATIDFVWPRWWRLALLAAGTLILCSCSAPNVAEPMPFAGPAPTDVLPADCADPNCAEGGQTLAGPPVMVDAATELLRERGVETRDMHADAFYQAPAAEAGNKKAVA